ncbi:MAG: YlxR family protein [Actinomycetales bacterium]|nr:YlxR family protein [Actinomycetales bacterium]
MAAPISPEATPIRTCVGCRRADSWSVLVRFVAVTGPSGTSRVVPDPRRRLPGRGAWLHPDPECFAYAVRRRAFGRALRLQAAPDTSAVTAYLENCASTPFRHTTDQGGLDADEHPMSTQQ